MKKGSVKRFLIGTGAVFTFLVGVGGFALAAYQFFSTPRSDLQAVVETNRFALPPQVGAAIEKSQDAELAAFLGAEERNKPRNGEEKVLADHKKNQPSVPQPLNQANSTKLASQLRFAFKASPAEFEEFALITVKNDGNKTAEKVELRLPATYPAGQIVSESGERTELSNAKVIAIGDLSPKQSVKILLWDRNEPSAATLHAFKDDASLYSRDSFGSVAVGELPAMRDYREKGLYSLTTLFASLGVLVAAAVTAFTSWITPKIKESVSGEFEGLDFDELSKALDEARKKAAAKKS